MPITFRCTSCDLALSFADTDAGRIVDCPICGTKLPVPDRPPGPPPASPAEVIATWADEPAPVDIPVARLCSHPPACVPLREPDRTPSLVGPVIVGTVLSGLTLALLFALVSPRGREAEAPRADLPPHAERADASRPSDPERRPPAGAAAVQKPQVPPGESEQPALPQKKAPPPAEGKRGGGTGAGVPDQTPAPAPKKEDLEKETPGQPAPPKVAVNNPAPGQGKPGLKRRDLLAEEDLRKQLLQVPEVALDAVPGTSASLLAMAKQSQTAGFFYPGPALLSQRPDVAWLPFRLGTDCLLGKEPAENLQVLSRKLRVQLEAAIPKDGLDSRPDPDALRRSLLGDSRREWLQADAVPAMLQLLQAENKSVRLVLVEMLGQIKDRKATEALAVRAMTDLSYEVRAAAVEALRSRPVQDYQRLLVEGLCYPWQPVGEHAAEALAALTCREAVPSLVQLLDRPEPDVPYRVKEGKRTGPLVVRELVRVNHLANCVLCHAPSFSRTDLVRGAVPTSGQPLPAPVTTPQYYDRGGAFVRADVTYLKQDFSVIQTVANPGAWPGHQRYDYLVRYRSVSTAEVTRLERQRKDNPRSSQRDAILFALQELTGKDFGPSLEAWKQVASPAGQTSDEAAQAEATRLGQELVNAPTGRRGPLLEKLRDNKGRPYSEALAQAIPKLQTDARAKARDALVERLTRMTAATLRDQLQDEDAEIRRAAALACAAKESRAHVRDIIPLLEDPDESVSRAAYAALRTLTLQDFGPRPQASAQEKGAAAAAWKRWWEKYTVR
jgi:HEAT repeat protein